MSYWQSQPLVERLIYYYQRTRAWARRATVAGLAVRSVLWWTGVGVVLVAFPHPVAVLIGAVPALVAAGRPGSHWGTLLLAVAIGATAVRLASGLPDPSVMSLVLLAGVIYLHHSISALAAQLRTDTVIPPRVLWWWAGRIEGVAGLRGGGVPGKRAIDPGWSATGWVLAGTGAAVGTVVLLIAARHQWRPEPAERSSSSARTGRAPAHRPQPTGPWSAGPLTAIPSSPPTAAAYPVSAAGRAAAPHRAAGRGEVRTGSAVSIRPTTATTASSTTERVASHGSRSASQAPDPTGVVGSQPSAASSPAPITAATMCQRNTVRTTVLTATTACQRRRRVSHRSASGRREAPAPVGWWSAPAAPGWEGRCSASPLCGHQLTGYGPTTVSSSSPTRPVAATAAAGPARWGNRPASQAIPTR